MNPAVVLKARVSKGGVNVGLERQLSEGNVRILDSVVRSGRIDLARTGRVGSVQGRAQSDAPGSSADARDSASVSIGAHARFRRTGTDHQLVHVLRWQWIVRRSLR